MCGIAGSINIKINYHQKKKILNKMFSRGPDATNYYSNSNKVNLFHSRLSIIDLEDRSNQPFKIDENIIIFNGEIYNYIELKNKLKNIGIKFKTNSDTEVILKLYLVYGLDFVNKLEGMWSLCIYDIKKNILIISRDKFGEKPLYYYHKNNSFFFGSEYSYFFELNFLNRKINQSKIYDYLSFGYKSLNANSETFYEDIKVFPSSSLGIYNIVNNSFVLKKYWLPNENNLVKSFSEKKIVQDIKSSLIKSVKLRMRSDVESGFLLSGGIDSSSLVSIASKILKKKINTFSVIDQDERYNEQNDIDHTVKDVLCANYKIRLSKKNFFNDLKNMIDYYQEPLPTITAFIHNKMISFIKKKFPNIKVLIEGWCSDELFGGYYDHYVQHLRVCKDFSSKKYRENLNNWNKFIKKNIRNKFFKNPNLYFENIYFREHIYDGYFNLNYLFKKSKNYFFEEKYFSDDLMKNRMMNELFYETCPVSLNYTDKNCMMHSIENRNPFLDSDLVNYMYSVPSHMLIKKGYNKYLLRQALNGIVNNKVRLNRKKKGFNASINTLIDFQSSEFKDFMNEKSMLDEIVNKHKLIRNLKNENFQNYLSKFIFNYINAKIFLKKFSI